VKKKTRRDFLPQAAGLPLPHASRCGSSYVYSYKSATHHLYQPCSTSSLVSNSWTQKGLCMLSWPLPLPLSRVCPSSLLSPAVVHRCSCCPGPPVLSEGDGKRSHVRAPWDERRERRSRGRLCQEEHLVPEPTSSIGTSVLFLLQ
jgi:hypothetical protein